jgi:ribosomal protein S18 acetylase RimI-like enzyme
VHLLVRSAAPAEYDAVGALTADIYGGEGLAGPAYVEILRDARSRAESPDTELLVAVDPSVNALLLGAVVFCLPDSPWAMDAHPDEAEMRMLVVAPTERGSGAGAALVDACIQRASAFGARRLVLSTKREMAAAQRLYGRLGFGRLPERDRTPRPGLELLAYSLDLWPQDSSSDSPSHVSTTRSAS